MDSPREPWKPQTSDLVLDAREARTDPQTGVVRLQNGSNLFFGSFLAWGIFSLGALLLNKSSFGGPDPMTHAEVAVIAICLVTASVLAHVVLARPFVTIRHDRARIRNPVRIYDFYLDEVDSSKDGAFGFLTLTISTDKVRVVGLEESLSQKMAGGSIDRAVLQAAIYTHLKAAPGFSDEYRETPGYSKRWAFFDRGLILLLAAWLLYGLSFLL